MSKKEAHPKGGKPAAEESFEEELVPSRLGRGIRAALIALVLATVALLSINDLNSYDTWTHLATGRLMWEEGRIPDSEPYGYSQNREMTLDEAAPQYAIRESVITRDDRLAVAAGTPFDNECKQKLRNARIPLEQVRIKLEPPLKRLVDDAVDSSGNVVAEKGTLLHDEQIEKLRAAKIDKVSVTVPWVNHEWLFQIPAYLSYKWWGMPGPTIFKTAIVVLAYFFVFITVYRKQTHIMGVAAVFLAAIVSYKRFYMRPEVFSILFTAVWLFVLERFRRRQHSWSICVTLPLLMVLWINTHGYFILGVAIMLIYLIGEALQAALPMPRLFTRTLRWKEDVITGKGLGKLAVATLLTAAATLVNPYGWDGARYPIDVLQQVADPTSVIRTVIGEMQPPFNFGFTYAVMFTWVLIWVSGASWLLNLRRFKFSRMILWIVSIIFLSKALRNMPFFGIPGAVFLGLNVNEAWPDAIRFLRQRIVPEALLVTKWVGQLAVGGTLIYFCLWMMSDRFYVNDIASIRCGLWYSEDKFSMGAAEFVRDKKIPGNLYNAFGMGGLCMWKLFPEERVGPDGLPRLYYGGRKLFIDGRAELYGGPFVKDYTRSLSEPEMWKKYDAKYHFTVAFLNWQASDTQPLMRQLYRDPDWVLCYGDGVGYVFVRNIPENRQVIEEARRVLESPKFVDFAEPYARLAASLPGIPSHRSFVTAQDRIWSLARILNGDPKLGDEALRVSENPTQVQFDRRFMNNWYDRLYEQVSFPRDESDPEKRWSFLPKRAVSPGEMLGVAGFALLAGYPDLSEAIINGLTQVAPKVAEIEINLANVYQQRGEFYLQQGDRKNAKTQLETALEHYRRAEKIMPDYPSLSLQLLRLCDILGDTQGTAHYLRESIDTIYPTVSSAGLIAAVCLKYDRDLEALRQYTMALELLPERDSSPLHERIAFCNVKLRRYAVALPHALRAVDLEDNNAAGWFTLGLCNEGLGRRDEAIKSYRRCLEFNPDFKPAQDHLRQLTAPPPPPTPPRPFTGLP